MEIAGYEIDVRKVIDETLVKASDFTWKTMPDLSLRNLQSRFEGLVWNALLAELVSKRPSSGNATAEQIVCALLKAGVEKRGVSYHGDRFKVVLTNRRYIVQKSADSFRAAPTGAERLMPVTGIPAKAFAEFMLKFDSMVQEIDMAARELEVKVREEQMRQRQEELAVRMTRQTVQSLVDEYVTPLGLDAGFDIHDGVVSIRLTLRKEASFTMTLDDLSEKLKDSEGLMGELKTVHETGLEIFSYI